MSLLSDLVVLLHFAYAAFVVAGFILILLGWWRKWHWIRQPLFRWLHLGCIALVALESVAGLVCPLTLLENWLLVGTGATGYERDFIANLLYNLLYYDFPAWVFIIAYVTLAVLTAIIMILIPPDRHAKLPQSY
ncbi:DUF2784 domain-containing protein [Candidatus Neomarinimicrobiota bacterium]